MSIRGLLFFVFTGLCTLSCQKETQDDLLENDFAENLYGIWNRSELGFRSCEDPDQNITQFADGSVGFDRGRFYSTYSIRDGKDRINTVRFEAKKDSIEYLSSGTVWHFLVLDEFLELTTNATNGCVRFINFNKSKTAN